MSLENKAVEEKKRKGISIKIVTVIYLIAAIIVMTAVITAAGYNFYQNRVIEEYEKYVKTVLDYAYTVTEDYSFGDMIAKREMPEEYEVMREELNDVIESSDIDYLYAICFDDINDLHSLTYAINAKTREELNNGGTYTELDKPCEEGSFEEDALTSKRIYKPAFSKEKAFEIILDGKGTQFDPKCVEVFLEAGPEIDEVLKKIWCK